MADKQHPHAKRRPWTNAQLETDFDAERQRRDGEIIRYVAATVIGLWSIVIITVFLDRVPAWAADWGSVPVYLAFFLIVAAAARSFWYGVDGLWYRYREWKLGSTSTYRDGSTSARNSEDRKVVPPWRDPNDDASEWRRQ